MGLTIHYRGKLRSAADVQPLANELTDICKSANWECNYFNFPFPETGDEPFSGVVFQPHPKSESVWMLFNEKGELSHPFGYTHKRKALVVHQDPVRRGRNAHGHLPFVQVPGKTLVRGI